MDCEVDLEVLHELYTALEETLDDADDVLITPELLDSCFSKIEMQVKRLLASRQERLDTKADEDIEEEDLELLDEAEEQEEELLQQARLCFHLGLACIVAALNCAPTQTLYRYQDT